MNYTDGINEVNRLDIPSMDAIFNFLKSSCSNYYKDLTRTNFNDCVIHIYTSNGDIKGIIGVKRTTVKSINIDILPFYNTHTHNIYSIEFAHIFDTYDINETYDIYNKLLKYSLADKNDLFTFISLKCPTMYNDPYYRALTNNGFQLYPYEEHNSNRVRFIRTPYHK